MCKKNFRNLYIRTLLLPFGLILIILMSIVEWCMCVGAFMCEKAFGGMSDTFNTTVDVLFSIVDEWKRGV
jgi:hypothetical protein